MPSKAEDVGRILAIDFHQATFALREVQRSETSQPWLIVSWLPYVIFAAVLMAIHFEPLEILILAIPATNLCHFENVLEQMLKGRSEIGKVCQRYILAVWCYIFKHILCCEKPICPGATRITSTSVSKLSFQVSRL